MKKTDKNILMITAGGVGQRFGADTPKQYCLLNGRPVIEYVIEAARSSRRADAILVVADPAYHAMLRETYGVDVTASGQTLNETKRLGFDYIREHSACEKLVVADAVRPAVTGEVLARLFDLLDDYDAGACAQKITDSLGCFHTWRIKREDYYTVNAPESFRFPLLDRCFRADSPLTESIQQLPETSRVKLLFDVPYFDKITYPEDLERMEALLSLHARRQASAQNSPDDWKCD